MMDAATMEATDWTPDRVRELLAADGGERTLVIDLLGRDFRLQVWTGPEWAALPWSERPEDAHLMSDGASRLQVVELPKGAGPRRAW